MVVQSAVVHLPDRNDVTLEFGSHDQEILVASGGLMASAVSRRPHDPFLPSHVSLLFFLLFLPPQPIVVALSSRRQETRRGSVHLLPVCPVHIGLGQTFNQRVGGNTCSSLLNQPCFFLLSLLPWEPLMLLPLGVSGMSDADAAALARMTMSHFSENLRRQQLPEDAKLISPPRRFQVLVLSHV